MIIEIIDKEKALLPATQIIVEAMNNKEKLQKTLTEYLIEFNTKKQEFYDEIQVNNTINNKTNNIQKKVFIKKCGVEDCRGFLSEQWKCGMCNQMWCVMCHTAFSLVG